MRLLLFILFLPISAISQVSDTDLTTQNNNTIFTTVYSPTRAGNMYQAIINSKVSLLGTYSNPSWISALAWSKITGAPSFLTTETDPLYTANGVPSARTLTINGTSFDLSANRSWTVGDVASTRALTINGTSGRITSSAGSQTLAADRTWTLDLATAGTAGTYTSVTTDAYGRVTSGTNPQIYLRGGNAFGANSVLGLTDNFDLTLQTANANLLLNTNGANRLTINSSGQWTTSVSVPSGTGTGYQFTTSLTGTGSGQALVGADINASFSGTLTSSNLDILRLRNNGTVAFEFSNTGQMVMGSQTGSGWIGVTNSAGSADIAGRTMNWRGTGNWGSSSTVSHLISLRQANINTGSLVGIRVSSPAGDVTATGSTGSNTYTLFELRPEWDFTGGTHTLIVDDYNPILNNMVGVTHVAKQWRSGEIRLGEIVQNDALAQVLVRDAATGAVRYRDVSTISGGGGTYYAPTTLVANATDANFTATVNGIHNILDGVATANRVITIPTGANGDVMKFYNTEDTRVWSFTGATVYLADRVTVVTELLYNVPCFMEKIDGLWIITN